MDIVRTPDERFNDLRDIIEPVHRRDAHMTDPGIRRVASKP